MAYRRIAYAALLGGAVLFQIVFRFYLSTFTLALVLLLPLLSVLLSLPSVLGCTLLLTSAAPTVVQGEDAVFQVRLRSRTRLPLPRLQARLHWSNQLTGAGGRVRWELGNHRALAHTRRAGFLHQIQLGALIRFFC